MVIYHPSKIIFYDPQVDSSIKTYFNIIGNHIWKLLTCRRSCYPPWSPGRLGLWETPRRCFAGALNFDSCNSHLPCNNEKGLRKRKIFSLKRTLYNLFFMKYLCLTMGFKCFLWKPHLSLLWEEIETKIQKTEMWPVTLMISAPSVSLRYSSVPALCFLLTPLS